MDSKMFYIFANDEFMTREEAAEFLRCTDRKVDQLKDEGMPAFRLAQNSKNSKVLFLKSEVIAWMKENKRA